MPSHSFSLPLQQKTDISDMTYNIKDIYTHYKNLTKKQRTEVLASLQSQGFNIVRIEAYEYADAPGIKHMFFYFEEDKNKAVPYFMLDTEVWERVQREIMER